VKVEMVEGFEDHGMECVVCQVPLMWDVRRRMWGTYKEHDPWGEMTEKFAYVHPWSDQPSTHDHYPAPKAKGGQA
jgi:hypothetical protein